MDQGLPEGVILAPLSRRVFDVLARHTVFPWPVLSAQCRRHCLDPRALSPADLERVLPHLVSGVTRFTTPAKGELVRAALAALLPPLRRS
jgi:hypothetical protein